MRTHRLGRKAVSIMAGGLLAALSLSADAASTIAYQGRLADSGGGALPDGSYTMRFTLHAESTGGDALWTEARSTAIVVGSYHVELGGENPFPEEFFAAHPDLWLETALDANSDGVYTSEEIFAPRVHLTAVPYTFAGPDGEDVAGSPTTEGAPEGSIPILGITGEVGDGTVDQGSVVSAYNDGKVRQSANRLPWAQREIALPGNGVGSVDNQQEFLHHTPLANQKFLISYCTNGTLAIESRKHVIQIAAELNTSTGDVTFGPRTVADEFSSSVAPLTVVLEDGADGQWPLTLTTYGTIEGLFDFGLSAINPETLQVVTDGARYPTTVSMGQGASLQYMGETATDYVVVVASTNGIFTYRIEKIAGAGEPELTREVAQVHALGSIASANLLALSPTELVLHYNSALRVRSFSLTTGLLDSVELAGLTVPSFPSLAHPMIRVSEDTFATQELVVQVIRYDRDNGLLVESTGQITGFEPVQYGAGTFVPGAGFVIPGNRRVTLARFGTTGPVEALPSVIVEGDRMTTASQDGYLFLYRKFSTATEARNFVRVTPAGAVIGEPIGVATSSAGAGETVPILVGGILDVSGGSFEPPQNYYAETETQYGYVHTGTGPQDGSLTISATTYKVGRAISNDQILVRLPR